MTAPSSGYSGTPANDVRMESAAEDADTRAWATEVAQACDQLPPIEREVLLLAYCGKRSQSDIARQLGLSLATVSAGIAEGLRRISARVDPRGHLRA